MTVTQSTLNGNHANFGGGIYADTGASFLQNATLSNNSVSELGGGIFNHLSAVSLINVTVYGNSASAVSYFEQGGGGLYTLSTTIELKNTTVAGNTVGQNCAGHIAITSDGFNLADDGHCNLTGPGDQANVTAQLGPLQDNGGPTLTHLPLAGSLAIDHGTNAGCPAIDQRGAPRPFGAACDIGAVEYGSAPPLDRHVYLPLVLK